MSSVRSQAEQNDASRYDTTTWGRSSTGRAPALQAGGWRFEPARLHLTETLLNPGFRIPACGLSCPTHGAASGVVPAFDFFNRPGSGSDSPPYVLSHGPPAWTVSARFFPSYWSTPEFGFPAIATLGTADNRRPRQSRIISLAQAQKRKQTEASLEQGPSAHGLPDHYCLAIVLLLVELTTHFRPEFGRFVWRAPRHGKHRIRQKTATGEREANR